PWWISDLSDGGVHVVRRWARNRLCQLPRFQLKQKAGCQILSDEATRLLQGPVLQDSVELQVSRHEEFRCAFRHLRPHNTVRPRLFYLHNHHDLCSAFERGGLCETERRKTDREDLAGQHKISRLRFCNDLGSAAG